MQAVTPIWWHTKAAANRGFGSEARARRPAVALSAAAKAALTAFLAQASLPPGDRETARCRKGPNNSSC